MDQNLIKQLKENTQGLLKVHEARSLEDLRAQVENEVDNIDVLPYSHNIVGLVLQQIASGYGTAAANQAIEDFGLEAKGWQKVVIKETQDFFAGPGEEDLSKRFLNDPNPFCLYDDTKRQQQVVQKVTQEIKAAIDQGKTFDEIVDMAWDNKAWREIGAADTYSREAIYNYMRKLRKSKKSI